MKYIFVKNTNDNRKSIKDFIELAKKVGVGKLQFDFGRR